MSPKVIGVFAAKDASGVEYLLKGTVGKRRAYTHKYAHAVPLRCIHDVSLKERCERCEKLP